MANVTVKTSGNMYASNRCTVRTAAGRVYVCITDGTTLEMRKGNQDGEPTSFSSADTITSLTSLRDVGAACAIDSGDVIHCIYYQQDTAHGGIEAVRYVTFNTSTDTFGTPETAQALDNEGTLSTVYENLGIAIDANDDPHIYWSDGFIDMGAEDDSQWYSNKTGASWRTRVMVRDTHEYATDIIIGEPTSAIGADRPIIVTPSGTNSVTCYHGTALDATGFTGATAMFSPQISEIIRKSLVIDDNGKVTIAVVEVSGNAVGVVSHLASSAWGTWESYELIDTVDSWTMPSMANVNTDELYIVVEKTSNNDLYLWTNESGSWAEDSSDPDFPNVGTFVYPKVKWAKYNNNDPNDVDYVFEDGTNIYYNTFNVPAAGAREIWSTMVNQSGMI